MRVFRVTNLSLALLVIVGLIAHERGATAVSVTEYYYGLQCNDDSYVHMQTNSTTAPVVCSSGSSYSPGQLWDLNGGSLEDGDHVAFVRVLIDHLALSVSDGTTPMYWMAPGYEHSLTDSEKFVIENLDCDNCTITDGTRVSLQNVYNANFLSAASCGSDYLNGNVSSRGDCERFEIRIY